MHREIKRVPINSCWSSQRFISEGIPTIIVGHNPQKLLKSGGWGILWVFDELLWLFLCFIIIWHVIRSIDQKYNMKKLYLLLCLSGILLSGCYIVRPAGRSGKVPPGQAKKAVGAKSARNFAPGHRKHKH